MPVFNPSFTHLIMCVYVLKTFSDEEHPMQLFEIENKIEYLSEPKTNKTAGRSTTFEGKLQSLVEVLDKAGPGDSTWGVKNSFIAAFGGVIRSIQDGKRLKFYFHPILSAAEIEMLSGLITTSPFLSEEEKSYLDPRVRFLSATGDTYAAIIDKDRQNTSSKYNKEIEDILTEPRFPKEPGSDTSDSTRILQNAIKLHSAILKKCQIRLLYAQYGQDELRPSKYKLLPKDREYIMNPYALCWNNGFYYLICSHNYMHNATHFRVDRILNVEPLYDNPVQDMPYELQPYFHSDKNQLNHFDDLKYRNEHPLMAIGSYKDQHIKCVFETSVLSIILDYFGTDIRIEDTGKKWYNITGKEEPIFRVTVQNVNPNSVQLFALQQFNTVRVIEPAEIANAVYHAASLYVQYNKPLY